MKLYLVLFILFCLCLNCQVKQGEDSVFILPKNYVGHVLILYSVEDGQPIKYKGNKRIYNIPENGILRTQFKPNQDKYSVRFYYGKERKNKTIPLFKDLSKVMDQQLVCFDLSTGVINKPNKGQETYMMFSIGKVSQMDSLKSTKSSFEAKVIYGADF